MMNELTANLDRLHTTELGAVRIRRNTGTDAEDVVAWCIDLIKRSLEVVRRGKNWYVHADGFVITINAFSLTVITAHRDER